MRALGRLADGAVRLLALCPIRTGPRLAWRPLGRPSRHVGE
jgi:hypothetical protein